MDEERFARKNVGFPKYENPKKGLGILDYLKENVLAMNDKHWPLALKLYHFFIRYSGWMKKGGLKAYLYKKMIMLHPDKETHTSTVVRENISFESYGFSWSWKDQCSLTACEVFE